MTSNIYYCISFSLSHSQPFLTSILLGLYATGCIIEHNCSPNCHFTFEKKNGFKLTVRAARDIGKGEHIATCYGNLLWGSQQRRQQLREAKYFNCCCERCADPTELGTNFSSLRCLGSDEAACDGGIQTPINPLAEEGDGLEWACNKCPIRVSGDQVAFIVSKMSEEIDNVIYKTPNVPAVESLMEKLGNFLHPEHYHMFTLKHSLIQLYGNHKDFFIESISIDALKRKLKLCDSLLQTLKRLDPHNIRLSIYTAVVLYEKFNSIAEMQRRQLEKLPCDEAVSCLESARVILINELDTIQGKQLYDKICEKLAKL
jgi:SET domain